MGRSGDIVYQGSSEQGVQHRAQNGNVCHDHLMFFSIPSMERGGQVPRCGARGAYDTQSFLLEAGLVTPPLIQRVLNSRHMCVLALLWQAGAMARRLRQNHQVAINRHSETSGNVLQRGAARDTHIQPNKCSLRLLRRHPLPLLLLHLWHEAGREGVGRQCRQAVWSEPGYARHPLVVARHVAGEVWGSR